MKELAKQYKIAFGFGSLISSWVSSLLILGIIIDLKFLNGIITTPILDLLYYGFLIQILLLIIFTILLIKISKK